MVNIRENVPWWTFFPLSPSPRAISRSRTSGILPVLVLGFGEDHALGHLKRARWRGNAR